MNSQELLQAWRDSVDDNAEPYLWSDDEAYRFMNDAYFMFVRLTDGVADFRSDETEVAVVEGEPLTTLSPLILRIMSATLRSTGRKVEVINVTDLPRLSVQDYGGRAVLSDLDREGEVRYLVTGMAQDRVRLIMVPTRDDVIDLVVYRLPKGEITGEDQEFEDVEGIHHIHLISWMSYLAYSKQDAETFDPRMSEFHKQEFVDYCEQVKREWERYKHKNRVVRYGGL